MKKNVGGVDRLIRVVVGLGLLFAGFQAGFSEPWNWVAMATGAVFTLTSLFRFCPLYVLFGFHSCVVHKE